MAETQAKRAREARKRRKREEKKERKQHRKDNPLIDEEESPPDSAEATEPLPEV